MILLKMNTRGIMRGAAAYLLLLLLSGQHATSQEEEGPPLSDLFTPTDDIHMKAPPAPSDPEISLSGIDPSAATIAAAAASAATAAAEAVGISGGQKKKNQEERLDEGGEDETAPLAFQGSSLVADITAALADPEEEEDEEEENLPMTIFPPEDILVEPEILEVVIEDNDQHHDSSFFSSSAKERNEGSRTWKLRERWDGFFGAGRKRESVDGRKRESGDGRGKPFKEALRSYDSLLKEHYAKMSFMQATVLGAAGDVIAQRVERRWNPGQKFQWRRTAHAGFLNMIIDGIFTPQWYNVVDHVNSDMTFRVALAKALAASTVYAPFANGMFLAGARVLRHGIKTRFDWDAWKRQLMVCTVRDFEMWPLLHILNFWLVPKHRRPLAGYLAGVVLLAVISSARLTDAGLPLGQRALPLVMRWGRRAVDAVTGRARAKA